ncbi:MAG: ABC transporter ATP-binding protein [Oscillospiraceae bacterium]|nr:ABC transporter ATP-binding protein [Oscillospiraceae bacterium]
MELKIDSVTKKFAEKTACDNVSLDLRNGIYGLLGSNGAGKTTLMRMMCGVMRPDSGTISYNGIDVSHEDYRDLLGYLPQDFGYYPEFTAMDFLLYISALKGIPKKRAKEKSEELLELTALTEVIKKKIKTFSGGMKQRLGIAQAMLNDPQILILDEPTAGLDPKERIRFRNLISGMSSKRIVLLSTHIVSDIEHIADTILIMKSGHLIQNGQLGDILKAIESKVWECTVSNDKALGFSEKYPVINLRNEQDGVFMRLVSDEKPCVNAVSKEAALEDLYLYYFCEEREEKK